MARGSGSGCDKRTAARPRTHTGLSELDRALAVFAAGYWSPPVSSIGGRLFPVEELREPSRAAGRCKAASEQFARFARKQGLHAQAEKFLIVELGYPPQDGYADHWLAIVSDEQGVPLVSVDWTASQFGLMSEFPLVRRLAA